ncbi:MAG: hypothetical protein ACYSTF_07715 [Planctomycetota bacterium]|jgi:hypothetical protein
MKCEECHIIIEEYLGGTIREADLARLKEHVDKCTSCRREFDRCTEAQRIVKEGLLPRTAASQARDSILSKLAAPVPKVRKKVREVAATAPAWTKILKSRATKLAAGALIVVALSFGLYQVGRVGVSTYAWGELPKRIGKIPVVTYRRIDIHPSMGTEGATITERIVYISSGQGTRIDNYRKGTLSREHRIRISDEGIRVYEYEDKERADVGVRIDMEGEKTPLSGEGIGIDQFWSRLSPRQAGPGESKNGTLNKSEYYLESENISFDMHHLPGATRQGSCSCWLLREKPDMLWYRYIDPREWIRDALAKDYRELRRKKLDGMDVVGVEIRGCELGIGTLPPGEYEAKVRVWVDIKTGLVIRYEARVRYGKERGDYGLVADRFQWHQKVDPKTLMPSIPEGYWLASVTVPKGDQDVTIDEGKELLGGLQLFAELTDGRYPSSMPAAVMEGLKAYRDKYGQQEIGISEDEVRVTETLAAAALFHGQLLKASVELGHEDKEVAYYGDRVAAEDVGAVLMRWKIGDGQYRVVFEDLTTEDVTAQRLAELEKKSEDEESPLRKWPGT